MNTISTTTIQGSPITPPPSYWSTIDPYIKNFRQIPQSQTLSINERGVAGFVAKLYQSLEMPENEDKYARWCTHNGVDMFIIEYISKFTEKVLPKLFKHCKFATFVRQLNIYGFQRDTDARKSKDSKDKETCRWYHPYFRPGRYDLFYLIRRKTPRYSRRKRAHH
ncbi:HSF-type DNA-binding-domain-containing protein [Spinellus fusiger]|nr:HSF-type DNA-binding-domain-containing protein [Spinellus fusiger]